MSNKERSLGKDELQLSPYKCSITQGEVIIQYSYFDKDSAKDVEVKEWRESVKRSITSFVWVL